MGHRPSRYAPQWQALLPSQPALEPQVPSHRSELLLIPEKDSCLPPQSKAGLSRQNTQRSLLRKDGVPPWRNFWNVRSSCPGVPQSRPNSLQPRLDLTLSWQETTLFPGGTPSTVAMATRISPQHPWDPPTAPWLSRATANLHSSCKVTLGSG